MAELVDDPLGDRILISPGRAARPYDFRSTPEDRRSRCPFCPGHEAQTPPEVYAVRESGDANTAGWQVRVTPNLYPFAPRDGAEGEAFGVHEVIIETPRHDDRLADLDESELTLVLAAWRDRILEAQKDERLKYGLIFKNQGPNAGASLEHPHSQFIALPFVPERAARQAAWLRDGDGAATIQAERESLDHLVASSRRLAAVAPAASRFSYELSILPKQPAARFEASDDGLLEETAELLGRLLRAMDAMLSRPDYHLLVHTAPFGEEQFWWRIELFPRLNRVAGFEWATGMFVNQTSPAEAVAAWRAALKD